MSFTPCHLAAENITLGSFDLKKAIAEDKKLIEMAAVKVGRYPIKIELVGETITTGINVSSEYHSHSIGFKFSNDDDLAAIPNLFNVFEDIEIPQDWQQKDLLKDGKYSKTNLDILWLKLKHDQRKSAYKFKSNIKLNPKKPQEAALEPGEEIKVTADLKAYFNLKDKIYGLSIGIRTLNIEKV